MRKFTKKFGTILLAGSLLATQMQGGLLANASSYYADNSDVEDAYDDYYAEHYEDNNNYLGAQSGKIDLNGDSIDEMWVTYAYGVRGAYDFLCYKNGTVKKIKTFKGDKLLRKLKYVILAVFVIILPMCVADITGLGDPWFCKYICPAGTLEGGIPLVLLDKAMRETIGFLYAWKFAILVILLLLSVIIYRPFCKYLCPLGGIYSLFNRISVFRLRFDESKCVGCKQCSKVCKMNVDPCKNPDHTECIRCGLCAEVCPTDALRMNFTKAKKNENKNEESKDLS